jgi:phage shock protein A
MEIERLREELQKQGKTVEEVNLKLHEWVAANQSQNAIVKMREELSKMLDNMNSNLNSISKELLHRQGEAEHRLDKKIDSLETNWKQTQQQMKQQAAPPQQSSSSCRLF